MYGQTSSSLNRVLGALERDALKESKISYRKGSPLTL